MMQSLDDIPLRQIARHLLDKPTLQAELLTAYKTADDCSFVTRLGAVQSAAFQKDGSLAVQVAANDTSLTLRQLARSIAARLASAESLCGLVDAAGHWERLHTLRELRKRKRFDVIDTILEGLRSRGCVTDFLNSLPFGSAEYVGQVYPLYHGWMATKHISRLAKMHPDLAIKAVQMLLEEAVIVEDTLMAQIKAVIRASGRRAPKECIQLLVAVCAKVDRTRWPIQHASECISSRAFLDWLLANIDFADNDVKVRMKFLSRAINANDFVAKVVSVPKFCMVDTWTCVHSKTIAKIYEALPNRDEVDFAPSFLNKLPRHVRRPVALRMIQKYEQASKVKEQQKAAAYYPLLTWSEAVARLDDEKKVSWMKSGDDLGRLIAKWPENILDGWNLLIKKTKEQIDSHNAYVDNPWQAIKYIRPHMITRDMVVALNDLFITEEDTMYNWRRNQALHFLTSYLVMDWPDFVLAWEGGANVFSQEWKMTGTARRFREPHQQLDMTKHYRLLREEFCAILLDRIKKLQVVHADKPAHQSIEITIFQLIKKLGPVADQIPDLIRSLLQMVAWDKMTPWTYNYHIVPAVEACHKVLWAYLVQRLSENMDMLNVGILAERLARESPDVLNKYLELKGCIPKSFCLSGKPSFIPHLPETVRFSDWTGRQLRDYSDMLVNYIYKLEELHTKIGEKRAAKHKEAVAEVEEAMADDSAAGAGEGEAAAMDDGEGEMADGDDQIEVEEIEEEEAEEEEDDDEAMADGNEEDAVDADDPFTWTHKQEYQLAQELTAMVKCLVRNPMWDPRTLKPYIDRTLCGTQMYLQEQAMRTFGKVDDLRGRLMLQEYLLSDDKARSAIYAIRPGVKSMRKEELLNLCRTMAWKGVSVAKEVVRLMGVARLTEARDELIASFRYDGTEEVEAVDGAQPPKKKKMHRDVRLTVIRAMWDYLCDEKTWEFLDSTLEDADFRVIRKVCWVTTYEVPSVCLHRLIKYISAALSLNNIKLTAGIMQRLSERPIQDMSGQLVSRLIELLSVEDDNAKGNCQTALRIALFQLEPQVRDRLVTKMFEDSSGDVKKVQDMCNFLQTWRYAYDAGTKTHMKNVVARYLDILQKVPGGEMNAPTLLNTLCDEDQILDYLDGLRERDRTVFRFVVWKMAWSSLDDSLKVSLFHRAREREAARKAAAAGRDEDETLVHFLLFESMAERDNPAVVSRKKKYLKEYLKMYDCPVVQALAMGTRVKEEEKTKASRVKAASGAAKAVDEENGARAVKATLTPSDDSDDSDDDEDEVSDEESVAEWLKMSPSDMAAQRRANGRTRAIRRGMPQPNGVIDQLQKLRKRALLRGTSGL